ncbi:hypothetical protein SAMN05444407_109168 [Chryseobacterium contaminans]|uniref:Uncharacterized protein n=1 Tax=Chryseobacterium contaminans TaxID=1423959 RepID=A0A1M7G4S1_9FLAO|nr:hypothetical protein SAMN05444407_109168 [Chryseobacterium contaminans]
MFTKVLMNKVFYMFTEVLAFTREYLLNEG